MYNQQLHDCYSSPVTINCRSVGQSSRRISSEIDENMENLEKSTVKISVQPKPKKLKFFKDTKFDVLADLLKQKKYEPSLVQKAICEARDSPDKIYKFYQFFQKNGWKILVEFTQVMIQKLGDCHNLLLTLRYLLDSAVFTDQPISKFQAQSCKNSRDPFESRDQHWIFNTSKANVDPQDFSTCFQQAITSEIEVVKFKKKEMLDLVRNKVIPQVLTIISEYLRTKPNPNCTLMIFEIVKNVAMAIQKEYSKGEEYDKMSRIYYQNGVFQFLHENMPETNDLLSIVKTIEFCSNQPAGLNLLYNNIEKVIKIIDLCFQGNQIGKTVVPQFQNVEILYSAATILLDLTANEQFIEKIAQIMLEFNMFHYVVDQQLGFLISKTTKLPTTQLKKLRDLFIGIVLNLACNIEDSNMIVYLVKKIEILGPLTKILVDSRNDWPTHGASQAIMQYSHLAMQDGVIFEIFAKTGIELKIRQILTSGVIKHPDALQHLGQSLGHLEIAASKQSQIFHILQRQIYAVAA